MKQLAKSVKHVLKDAEKQILKAHPGIISGEFLEFLKVHPPKKKTTSSGEIILPKPVGERKTYYIDEQELFS